MTASVIPHGSPSDPAPGTAPSTDAALERELAELFVSALNLDTQPQDIDPTVPLYDDGLGLDSIDILELALVVSKRYGIDLRADDADNSRIFASLQSLAQHIQLHRTR